MVDYNRLQATAQRLIAKNGGTVTLVKHDASKVAAAEPWRGPADPVGSAASTLSVPAALLDPVFTLGFVSETSDLVKRSTKIYIIPLQTVTNIRQYHEVLDGTEYWKIVHIEELNPAGTPLLALVGVAR